MPNSMSLDGFLVPVWGVQRGEDPWVLFAPNPKFEKRRRRRLLPRVWVSPKFLFSPQDLGDQGG